MPPVYERGKKPLKRTTDQGYTPKPRSVPAPAPAPSPLRGRELAITRGQGKKLGLKKQAARARTRKVVRGALRKPSDANLARASKRLGYNVSVRKTTQENLKAGKKRAIPRRKYGR